MASRDEVLRDLVSRVDILETRVRELEKENDGWDDEFEPSPQPVRRTVDGPLPHAGEPDEDVADDDPAVLAARERIAQDDGVVPDPPLEVEYITIDQGDRGFVIDIPKATPDQLAIREEIIKAGVFENFPQLPAEVVAEGFRKGGPLWLHAFDRDFVMSLPRGLRRILADDVYLTGPTAAGQLAADILKAEPGDDSQAEWAFSVAETLNG